MGQFRIVKRFLVVLVICLLTTPAFAEDPFRVAWGLVGNIGGGTTGGQGAQIFYSDFNSEGDDAQWGVLPPGWNDDYATPPAPLEGVHSGYSDGGSGEKHISNVFTDQTSGTTYARIAFRALTFGGSIGESLKLELLDSLGIRVATAALYWSSSTNNYYRLYVYDSANNAYVIPSPASTFNDATYYLYLTYNRGVSVVATVKDAAGTQVGGYTKTLTTAESKTVSKVSVGSGQNAQFVFDTVEVRVDEVW